MSKPEEGDITKDFDPFAHFASPSALEADDKDTDVDDNPSQQENQDQLEAGNPDEDAEPKQEEDNPDEVKDEDDVSEDEEVDDSEVKDDEEEDQSKSLQERLSKSEDSYANLRKKFNDRDKEISSLREYKNESEKKIQGLESDLTEAKDNLSKYIDWYNQYYPVLEKLSSNPDVAKKMSEELEKNTKPLSAKDVETISRQAWEKANSEKEYESMVQSFVTKNSKILSDKEIAEEFQSIIDGYSKPLDEKTLEKLLKGAAGDKLEKLRAEEKKSKEESRKKKIAEAKVGSSNSGSKATPKVVDKMSELFAPIKTNSF